MNTAYYPKVKKMKVVFDGHRVTLNGESDRKMIAGGVEIWIQRKPAGCVRPMATIPDGTLEQYKHCRPEWTEIEWEE